MTLISNVLNGDTTSNHNRNNISLPVDISSLSISSLSDYHVFDYSAKDLQREQVIDLLDQQGFIPDELIEYEVNWFYNSLGIDDLFFSKEKPEMVANLINSLYASKLDSYIKLNLYKSPEHVTSEKERLQQQLDKSEDDSKGKRKGVHKCFNIKNKIFKDPGTNHAILMESNSDGKTNSRDLLSFPAYELDTEVDNLFLDNKLKPCPRLLSFWSPESELKLTFIYDTQFPEPPDIDGHGTYITPEQLANGDIDSISDLTLSTMSSIENKKLYGRLLNLVQEREGPIIKTAHSVENKDEIRLLVAYKRFTTKNYYSSLNSLFHYYKLRPSKFYVESFNLSKATNVIIFSIYLNKSQQCPSLLPHDLELSIKQIEREASLLYTIPNHSFIKVFEQRQFSPQEAIYAHIGSIFINHFINRLGSDYNNLLNALNPKANDTCTLEIITNFKKKLRNETFTQIMINNCLMKHYKIVSKLYKNFAETHYYQNVNENIEATLSYKRLSKLEPFQNDQEFEAYLNKFLPNDSPDLLILQTLNLFNKSILKTNFFFTRKVAISFRLDPKIIMPIIEYPEIPYGIFFIIGSTFKGFHIRFRDIARGGIRIVCSRTQDIFDVNSKSVIDENYQLAATQQKKNKDLPEGGSKGVILLNPGLIDKAETFIAFTQYIDALIDILIQDPLKENYIDLLDKEEILFLGPDEGSAGFVNWATQHARKRGCPWWKSFLTGKSQSLGGIPHDKYGMTSIGVRSYVEKIYDTLNLWKSKIAKFQTGGPDGDLGSNEILLSSDNEVYVGILDGSGVLCDPKGIDKDELKRLASFRKTVSNFDLSKLSKLGFFVSIDDMDIMLPNGTIVANGTTFRNIFHTQIFKFVDHVDLFVPCGGRPNSINLTNLNSFIDDKTGKSKIPYIVEGANLFITQPAKVALESHGCILFKDASANKGGVTSSSLEVLASLALDDNDFVNKFIGSEVNKTTTKLYNNYVNEVQQKIRFNAQQEFTQLWKVNQATGIPISEVSNTLSSTINKLNDDLVASEELWLNDIKLRNYLLLNKIIPNLLIEVAGPKKILENIPEAYLKVLLSSYLASSFVYANGIDVNIGKFLEFIGELRRDADNIVKL
ncbi:hypothetical protein KAFR_0F00370 [Kazachstania africana CBS 2517]|uniref:NAD-specific glutamate dehydrogenase n=1 Tax=Kazachstania africana (strain ATCC 22294 / BCRC 22015 / CBS 2517 / CECT 1963 / NBRC 1671 / NRRL Y-8276) TaxID=1071382 RepID=H2AW84_KAZAF|nr:hypothetical protein KAFR_0F00370 [Kazachstania africana CBS 2517]CCF58634.1 hypothetical protein KAFR_0F00370 [Kazachstania africana CBS 2517]